MSLTVEYLVVFSHPDSFCDSPKGFVRFLQVNSDIVVQGKTIIFKRKPTCSFFLSAGNVKGKSQRYFQLKFVWEEKTRVRNSGKLDHFASLLKAIRVIVSRADGSTETLRDDISTYYAKQAYPLIHDVENQMRRLIANFMLVNVGLEWTAEALPSEVVGALQKSKKIDSKPQPAKSRENDYLNALHKLDFNHLGQILFNPYSTKSQQDLYAALKQVKTVKQAKALTEFTPLSNWARYFAKLIACDDSYLKTRWEKLYDLRCKVAHNTLMNEADFNDIDKLVKEVQPKILEGISKLPKVNVPTREARTVAESAAMTISAAVGDFISLWQELEARIFRWFEKKKKKVMVRTPTTSELLAAGVFDRRQCDAYERLRMFRNNIVHRPANQVSFENFQRAVNEAHFLIDLLEDEDFIAKLRKMRRGDLEIAIDNLIANTKYEILDTEEFSSAMAVTNASDFDIDDYEVENIEMHDDKCTAKIKFYASGDQDEDKPFCGNKIHGEADIEVDENRRVSYLNISASVDDYGE